MTENDTFAFDPEGNAASALGFSAVGVHAGFRADPERLDMALVVADEPCAAAATFTTNVFCAAPVRVSREHLNEGGAGSPAYGCAGPLSSTPASRTPPRARSVWKTPARPPSSS